jgi:KaiC/GvpD/RAD55 family RecA-like ATPase
MSGVNNTPDGELAKCLGLPPEQTTEAGTAVPAVENKSVKEQALTSPLDDIENEISNVPALPSTIPSELAEVLVDYTKEIEKPETVLSIGDKPAFTRGNISCITGQAKSRKSFLIASLAADILKAGGKVLLCDTEQGKYHVVKAARRALRTAGLDPDVIHKSFIVLRLREEATDKRKERIEEAINYFKPDVCFIDGIRDLVTSINDEEQATETCNWLMQLSSKTGTHICVVLHQNKNDTNARGHIGTELKNKSETVLSVTKEGECSKVNPDVCRNVEFEPFAFCVNEDGLPERVAVKPTPTEQEKREEICRSIFADRNYQPICYNDLINELCKRCKNKSGNPISEATAKSYLRGNGAKRSWITKGIISHGADGMYRLANKYCPSIDNDDV